MNNENGTMYGFFFCVILVVWCASTWGDPDLMDAFIYYLSDGFYKT